MAAELQFNLNETDLEAIRLAGRITYGVNRSTTETAKRLGYEGFVEWQLNYENIDDSELERVLKGV